MSLPIPPRLHRDQSVLLVVDVQEKLVPAMFEAERVTRGVSLLCRVAKQLQIPVVVTEQNPQKLGKTIKSVHRVLDTFTPHEKMRFSACTEEVMNDLDLTNKGSVILCGLETHVCISQTALDLVENGFTVFVPQDGVSSRYESDKRAGLERMRSAGVIPSSVEMAIYELLGEADTDDFRALLSHLK